MTSPNTQNSLTAEEAISATLGTSLANTWSSDGGYDYELLGGSDSRYECPICLLCLKDPVLTTCGHRFCSSCINQWVINQNGKCPVDSVSLAHENIFPDNFTRREIMQCLAKCPFTDKVGCTAVLPISDLEKHIQTEHTPPAASGPSLVPNVALPSSSSSNGGLLDCPYKGVGCATPLRQDQFHLHQETNVHHHLTLLTAAYKRLKIYSSRSNLDYPPGGGAGSDYFHRQDPQRESTRWLLDESLSPDDYQFRRQRSWDSVRFARKHNNNGHLLHRPSTNLNSTWLPESDESLCHSTMSSASQQQQQSCGKEGTCGGGDADGKLQLNGGGGGGGIDPRFQDLFQRVVLLEQKDREKQIKIDRLEAERASLVTLCSSSARIISDFTARYCHGVFVWRIHPFRQECAQMLRNPNYMLSSPGFYTDVYGYRLGLRFNLFTYASTSSGGSSEAKRHHHHHPHQHQHVHQKGTSPSSGSVTTLTAGEDTFISLYIHFLQGENDDMLRWPFIGKMTLMVVHPTNPEESLVDELCSNPNVDAFRRPTLPKNPKGFGYQRFSTLPKILNDFVKDDTLVVKVVIRSASQDKLSDLTSPHDDGE